MADSATATNNQAISMQVFLSPPRIIQEQRTFSPVTSTLFTGQTDAILVDAQFYREDVEALIDTIAASGKRLTTIYITHAHFDHWYGAGAIASRFPGTRIVALPGVLDYIGAAKEQEAQIVRAMFGDRIVTPTALPEAMTGDTIDLEGHVFQAIGIGQGDIPSSTVLHSRELGAVIVGDLAYNNIHMMLGLSGPDEWDQWASNIVRIQELEPEIVVVGHKSSGSADDEPDRILSESRKYIGDFKSVALREKSAPAIVTEMTRLYPHFGNVTTLEFSAVSVANVLNGKSPPSTM